MQIKKNAPVIQSYGIATDLLDEAIQLECFVTAAQAKRIQAAVALIWEFKASIEDAGKLMAPCNTEYQRTI